VISTSWLKAREPHWRRLDHLVERTSTGGYKSLTRDELQELGLLYRQIASDLAALRDDRGSAHYAQYLNQLLARAHHTIYSAERQSPRAIFAFWLVTFPQTLRRNLGPIAVALALFAGAAIVGALLTVRDPDFKTSIIGPQMVETIDRREMWTHSIVAVKPVASSAIMTNNLSVALMTFGMGITAGIGTVYMLIFNGLLIGVIGTACATAGMSLQLWSFVAPHGVLELPAIMIAGGAGLRLAQGLLFPGLLPRRESVSRAGGEGVKLTLGCVPILVVAGIIEGFVSPTDLSVTMKFTMAAATFVLFVAYLAGSGYRNPGAGRTQARSSDRALNGT
jgi:uncharacterized membrane protein SpoIIM required for sporulation